MNLSGPAASNRSRGQRLHSFGGAPGEPEVGEDYPLSTKGTSMQNRIALAARPDRRPVVDRRHSRRPPKSSSSAWTTPSRVCSHTIPDRTRTIACMVAEQEPAERRAARWSWTSTRRRQRADRRDAACPHRHDRAGPHVDRAESAPPATPPPRQAAQHPDALRPAPHPERRAPERLEGAATARAILDARPAPALDLSPPDRHMMP